MFKKVGLFIIIGTFFITAFISAKMAWAEGENTYPELENGPKSIVNIEKYPLVKGLPPNNGETVVDTLLKDKFISRKDRDKEDTKFPEAKQVREKYRPQMLQIKASVKELRGKVAKELTSNNPSKTVVKNYINQLVELRRKQQMLLVDQMFETLELLPKEKRADYIQPIVEHCLR